jgi:predicted permease
MLTPLLEVVLPVFAVAAVGFWYAGYKPFPVGAVTDLIIHVTAACLVFEALAGAETFALSAARAPASAALLILGGVLTGLIAHKALPPLRRLPRGAVVLPCAFMNAGNLGLPLMKLAYGEPGLQTQMLFFVTFAALQYSLGIALVRGRGGLQEVFRLPLVYAAGLGLLFNQTGWRLPNAVGVPVHLLGQTVIPLMLLSLGARMRTLAAGSGGRGAMAAQVALITGLRMGVGLLFGFGVNLLLGNEGLVAKVTLLTSALPSAVMNFALVEKYSDDPAGAAVVSGAIAAGTLLAVAALPVLLSAVG